LEVEAADAAQLAHLDRDAGRQRAVHRRAHDRQLEAERVELPGDVDVFRVARPPARDDRDVVEPVGPSSRLTDADLDFQPGTSRSEGSFQATRGASVAGPPATAPLHLLPAGPVVPVAGDREAEDAQEERGEDARGGTPHRLVLELVELHRAGAEVLAEHPPL